jgi:DNA polymerase-3 subunit beta
VSAHAADIGDNADELEANVEGTPTTIAFNARYLTDVLTNLGTDEAILELSGPLAPGVVRGVGNDDYVHVIMPVRTAS